MRKDLKPIMGFIVDGLLGGPVSSSVSVYSGCVYIQTVVPNSESVSSANVEIAAANQRPAVTCILILRLPRDQLSYQDDPSVLQINSLL